MIDIYAAECIHLRARQRAESGLALCRDMCGTDNVSDSRVALVMAEPLREVRVTACTLSLAIEEHAALVRQALGPYPLVAYSCEHLY